MEQVSGGFLMKKNKFLFGKRSKKKKWAPGMWDIVGGHSDANEDPLDTLKREAKEELDIEVLNARLLTSIHVPDELEGNVFRYHIFMITAWKGKAINNSKEHTKLRWMTHHEIEKVKLAMPLYLQLISDWLQS